MNKIAIGTLTALALVGTLTLNQCTRHQSQYQYATHIDDPENTIVLWDLHKVILPQSLWTITKNIVTNKNTPKSIWHLSWPLTKKLASYIMRLAKGIDVTSDEWIMQAKKHNNQALAQLIVDITNDHNPITGTVDILRELKTMGVRNHFGSNIGTQAFTHLKQQKFFKPIWALFDPDHKSQTVSVPTTPDEPIIQKPDPKFFIHYLEKNGLTKKLQEKKVRILFVDDKMENITAAQSVDIEGIHFTNPERLRHDLGLLKKQTMVT